MVTARPMETTLNLLGIHIVVAIMWMHGDDRSEWSNTYKNICVRWMQLNNSYCIGYVLLYILNIYLYFQNVKGYRYKTREQFQTDVNLIYSNSIQYNGAESNYTRSAKRITEICQEALQEVYHVDCSKIQWSFYFKIPHGTKNIWSYIAGGLKIKVI